GKGKPIHVQLVEVRDHLKEQLPKMRNVPAKMLDQYIAPIMGSVRLMTEFLEGVHTLEEIRSWLKRQSRSGSGQEASPGAELTLRRAQLLERYQSEYDQILAKTQKQVGTTRWESVVLAWGPDMIAALKVLTSENWAEYDGDNQCDRLTRAY